MEGELAKIMQRCGQPVPGNEEALVKRILIDIMLRMYPFTTLYTGCL